MEAVLRAGPGAYLTHDAVLALHDLGQVNPRRIRIATPKRARPHTPDYVEIIKRDLPAGQLTTVEGIPATTVAQALPTDVKARSTRNRCGEGEAPTLPSRFLLLHDLFHEWPGPVDEV